MAGVATRRDSARSRSGPVRHWRRRVCRSSVLSRRMGRSGDCVREEYCDEVAYIEGITCPWSDRRIRRTGAPHVEECPSADSGHPSAAALAEMVRGPIRSRSRSMRTATRWRASDWRGLGICGANSDVVCPPSRSADEVCFNFLESPGLGAFGGSLRVRRARGPERAGVGLGDAGGELPRYRALHPDQVRCDDAEGNPFLSALALPKDALAIDRRWDG